MAEMIVNNFNHTGYCMVKLEKYDLEPIWEEVLKIKNDFESAKKINQIVIGSVKKQFELFDCKEHIENITCAMVEGFERYKGDETQSNYKTLLDPNINSRLVLSDLWVNFQQKHEFIPIHLHGGIYSFALWLDIPYSIEEEQAHFPDAHKEENLTGHFQFCFPDVTGRIQYHKIPVDKTFNGTIALWPANMSHQVYPFYTSDEYRISIAGNLKISI